MADYYEQEKKLKEKLSKMSKKELIENRKNYGDSGKYYVALELAKRKRKMAKKTQSTNMFDGDFGFNFKPPKKMFRL